MRRQIVPPTALLAALLVAVAGCASSVPPAGDTSVPTTSAATTPPPTTGPTTTDPGTTLPSYLTPAVECPVSWVGFYALTEYERRDFWEPDYARIGFTVSGPASFFFVVYRDGSRIGQRHVNVSGSVTADGSKVPFDRPLSGFNTIRIVAHTDVDENGEFDPKIDRPCRNDGQVVQTRTATLDFSELEGTSTPKTTEG